jgi:hypothetical protein
MVKSSVSIATVISLLLPFKKEMSTKSSPPDHHDTSSSVLVGTTTASAKRTVEQEAVRHLRRGHTVVDL